jgi:hypothetical protein
VSLAHLATALCWALAAFQLLHATHRRQDSLDGESAHRNVATYTQHNTNTDIHISSGIRTHDPSVQAGEGSSCSRPRSHCDRRRCHTYCSKIVLARLCLYTFFVLPALNPPPPHFSPVFPSEEHPAPLNRPVSTNPPQCNIHVVAPPLPNQAQVRPAFHVTGLTTYWGNLNATDSQLAHLTCKTEV